MFKFSRLFTFLTVVLAASSTFAATTITVVDSAAPIGQTGHTIDVTLSQDNGTLSNFQVDFSYDTSVLEITGASLDAAGGSYTIFANQPSGPSSYLFAGADFTGTGVSPGTEIRISFTANVKGDASAGISAVTLTTGANGSKGPDGDANAVLNDGTFEALSFGISYTAASATSDGRITTTEAAGQGSFNVVLNTQPAADVVVDLTSDNLAEGTVSPTTLTFTTSDWDQAQLVTVTGVDDDVDDEAIDYSIGFTASSADSDYDSSQNGLLAADPALMVNLDDDTAGVTVALVDGSTDESGATGSFTVVLDSEPVDNVSVALASSDATEGQVTSSTPLTFTAGNWDQPQTVTVTGQDDDIDENGANVGYTVDLTMSSGSDDNYDGIAANSASLTNADNDGDTAGVTVTVTDATTSEVGSASEKAGTFTVVLTSEPTADVTIDLASDNAAEGVVTAPAGKQLTFTPGNWNQAQTVTVTGEDELVDDGNVSYNVDLTVSSTDGNYANFVANSAGLTNVDDDEPGIVVSVTNADSEEDGTAAEFEVRLGTEPAQNVTLTFSSSNTSEGAIASATMNFTPSNWDETQTLTVIGQDDSTLDGNIAYNVTVAGSGSDPTYGTGALDFIRVGANPDSSVISVTNLDNEANSLAITLSALRVAATVGVPQSIDVTATDVNGRPADVNGNHNVTFSGLATSPDSTQATVGGSSIGTVSLSFSNGIAGTTVTAYKAENTTLHATLASNPSVNSNGGGGLALEVSAAPADSLNYVAAPSGPNTAGVAWADFSVEITDEFGNRVSGNSFIQVSSDQGSFQGNSSVQASNGLATFSGLSHSTAGTHTVTADINGLTPAIKNGIVVNPAAIDHYAITFPGGTETAGVPFTVNIQAQDAFNNDITSGSDASETVSLSTSSDDPGLTPSSVSTTDGAATVNVTATLATSSQSISFTGGTSGQTGTTTTFAVNPGLFHHLTFTDQPSNSVAVPGTIASGGDAVVVELRDEFDNLRTSGNATVNLELLDGTLNQAPSTGTLSGTTSIAASNGIATFTNLSVDTEGVYRLRALLNERIGTSAVFAIGDPPPAETASSSSIDGGSDQGKIFTTDEANGRVVTLSASFDESIDPGRGQVTQGTVAQVVWAVDGNTEQTDGNATDSFTSTFDFAVGFDRVSSGDGSHGNTQVFIVTATATDNNGSPTVVTWTITVNDTNRAPTITGVTITVAGGGSAFADSTLEANPQGVADADNDDVTFRYEWMIDGNPVAFRVDDSQLSGAFAKDQVVTVKVTPLNATRDDNTDGASSTSAGTTILNSAPIVDDQVGAVDDNATTTINLSNNVIDVDDDSLTYSVSSNAAHGRVQISGANADYTADWAALAINEEGTDTFSFQANDGTDSSNNGTVSITVTGVNDNPTANGQSLNVRANAADTNPANSVEITLAGDDVDSDDNGSSLDFQILSLPDGSLVSTDPERSAVGVGTVLTINDFPLTFTPDNDFRGLTDFTFQTIDQHDARSAIVTVKITVGTPPWFRFIDLTEYDGSLDSEEPVGFYQVEVRDGASVLLSTQISNKAAVEPQDYLNAGSAGLLPGNYLLTIRKFNGITFDDVVVDTQFVVEDYPAATAQQNGNPTTENGNRVFSFDLDFAAGYILCITQPNAEVLRFEVPFRPDNDGVIPLSGTFTRSVFLPQAGNHTWKIIAFNPKGESATSEGAAFANTGGDFAPPPSVVDVRAMVPGGWDPNSESEDDVRDDPPQAGTATTIDGASVANITLAWDAASGAREYHLFLSTYGREVIINTDTTVDANTTTFGPLALPPGLYFWHVIAINDQGGTWSRAAYFRVASDPNSDLPNIDGIFATPQAGGVNFEADGLRAATHIQLAIVKRTDSFHRIDDLFVPVSSFQQPARSSYIISDGSHEPSVNDANVLYVYQARAVNLVGNASAEFRGTPNILQASRWTAIRRYTGFDAGQGGIGTVDVDQVDILAGFPTLQIDVPGATNIQVQYRAYNPSTFEFSSSTVPTDNVHSNNSAFTVPLEFQTNGVHVHVRVRGANADGSETGPWSGWAVQVNSSTR